jgi:hypothetical protein
VASFRPRKPRVSTVTKTSAFSQVFSSCRLTCGVEQPQLDETDWMWTSSSKLFSTTKRCSTLAPRATAPKSCDVWSNIPFAHCWASTFETHSHKPTAATARNTLLVLRIVSGESQPEVYGAKGANWPPRPLYVGVLTTDRSICQTLPSMSIGMATTTGQRCPRLTKLPDQCKLPVVS